MTETNSNSITETISLTVSLQTNGQYICEMTSSPSDRIQDEIRTYGQSQEHAVAIALEQLADKYRQIAEEQQATSWDAVERSETGEPIQKQYHVLLHYEDYVTAESKFEAMHNTILGNTVIENAKITVIEVPEDLPVQALLRSWE